MNMDEANVRLERFYDTVEQYRPTAHINRIYFHAGYTIEEVIANLRGIMTLFAEQVGEVQDKLNDLLTRIELILQKIIDEKEPEIVAQIIGDVTEMLTSAMSLYNGVPQLSQLLYEDKEDKVFNSDLKSANAVASLVSPRLARNAVLQNLWHDPHDGSWFFTQSDNKVGSTGEGFVISHTDAQGDFKSSMWVKNGGHGQGTSFVVQPDAVYGITMLHDNYATFQFQGKTTIDLATGGNTWTTPGGGATGNMEYTETSFGDVFVEYPNKTVRVYKTKWNGATNQPEFEGDGVVFDISPYLTATHISQGITAIPEQEISGVPSHNILIVLAYNTDGFSEGKNHNAVMKFLRYDYDRNTIEYIKEITRLDQSFKPATGANTNTWASNVQELEGVFRIHANAGSKSGQELGGLGWGISSGGSTQRTIFAMGFVAPNLLANLATAKVRNQRRSLANYEETTHLYELLTPGRYVLTGEEMSKFNDTPVRWRGLPTLGVFYLDVETPDTWGAVTQTLTMAGKGTPISVYQRNVIFDSNDGWGATYEPLAGNWQTISSQSQDAQEVTASYIKNTGITKLSQIVETNVWLYMTYENSKLLDLEGLDPQLEGRGFKVRNDPESVMGAGGKVRQTVVANSNTGYFEWSRHIEGPRDPYGPGLTRFHDVTAGPWFKHEGTDINSWKRLPAGDGSKELYYNRNNDVVTIKGHVVPGVKGTGEGNSFVTLPESIRPTHGDVWGIPIFIEGSDQFFTSGTILASNGNFYISQLPTGKTLPAGATITFTAVYNK